MNDHDIDPEPYSKEEEEFIEYLIKKYGKKLSTKEENYRVYN
jgi:hypothetical protein